MFMYMLYHARCWLGQVCAESPAPAPGPQRCPCRSTFPQGSGFPSGYAVLCDTPPGFGRLAHPEWMKVKLLIVRVTSFGQHITSIVNVKNN